MRALHCSTLHWAARCFVLGRYRVQALASQGDLLLRGLSQMKPKVSNINVEQWTANRAVCSPNLGSCLAGKEMSNSMPSLLETLRAAAAAAEEKVIFH